MHFCRSIVSEGADKCLTGNRHEGVSSCDGPADVSSRVEAHEEMDAVSQDVVCGHRAVIAFIGSAEWPNDPGRIIIALIPSGFLAGLHRQGFIVHGSDLDMAEQFEALAWASTSSE